MGKGGNAKSERCLLPDRLTEHNKDYITTQCKTPVNSQKSKTWDNRNFRERTQSHTCKKDQSLRKLRLVKEESREISLDSKESYQNNRNA